MNLENIKALIKNQEIKDSVMKIIEYEQSQLHKTNPRYTEKYTEIIEEACNAFYKD